ncbi:MAG TPA: hypothetical protein ENI50_02410, partial [Euryarchaeota archaeon]|nr:hypothetical protein [Euryarchaeota archaeon]
MAEGDIDIGLIMKKAFQTVFHDVGYISIYFVPAMVGLIILLLMQYVSGFNSFLTFQNLQSSPTAMSDKMGLFIIMLFLYVVSIGVTGLVALAAATIKIDRYEKKTTIGAGEAFREGLAYFSSLLGAAIVAGLMIAAPLVLAILLMIIGVMSHAMSLIGIGALLLIVLIIPVIYIGLRLSLFAQACVLDNLGAVECVRKSWHVTKGNVLLLFVTGLILAIITLPLSLLNNIAPMLQIGTFLSTLIVGLISSATWALIHKGLTVVVTMDDSQFDT